MKRHSFKDKVKWVWVVLIGALFLLQITASAIAHPFIIDQENINFSGGGNANAQEFTPALDTLDVVEVFIGPRDPETVAVVNIRIGSITGPIIGTSLPTGPVPGSQIVHFDFPSTVPLVPGELYVYKVSILSGFFAFVTGPNTYAGGRAIMFGVPQPDLDSSFRLGISSDLPPTVTCGVAVDLLWPPNHKLVNVGLSANVSDTSDPNPTIHVQVFGNESADSSDAADIGLNTLRLRAERLGGGDGRVYLIVVTATDAAGNVGFDVCTVVVPHSQSQSAINTVRAQAAEAEAFYRATPSAPPGYFFLGDRVE